MKQLKRYIQIFIKALIMTLRGEKPEISAEKQFPVFFEWIHEGQVLINTTYKIADENLFDETQRKACKIKIDGRDMSMEIILTGIQHHLTKDYVYMMNDFTNHSLTGIHALNLNDHYWITRLIEDERIAPAIRETLEVLAKHLEMIPSGNDLS